MKNDNECENYEKLSILFLLGELLYEVKSCNIFLESNFHYLKVSKSKNNSFIKLELEFLEQFINNLNEESPQYFNLVEIDSGVGHYQGSKIFTYDIKDINFFEKSFKRKNSNYYLFLF